MRLCITEKDIKKVKRNRLSGQEGTIVDTEVFGRYAFRISVCRASDPWPYPFVVRLEVWQGQMYFSQFFEDEEELMRWA